MKSRLKEILEDKGIKQTHLAKVTGANKSTINRIVNKGAIPALPLAYKIAKELDKHIEDIWFE
ncbi:helix-turn-helix transcriptional regulator [Virgibacillus salexigens]|uniref:helix-turn-helix transcriptional regulator n=1 Tax=Virgibacillus salexigens TaxID=61016 RepID=UPI00190B8520|nr:helix-turn-helix domain-containing protein [Virgibacillus salexigens]